MIKEPDPWYKNRKFVIFIVVLIICGTIVLLALGLGMNKESKIDLDAHLEDKMSAKNCMQHLKQLEAIAYANGGSRTALTGYNASVDYVESVLRANTDYIISRQNFQFAFFQELAQPKFSQLTPKPANYIYQQDFQNIRYGASGQLTGKVQYVNGGCTDQDYTNFNGPIALLNRGFLTDCSMVTKFANAIKFGATGVLIINDPDKVGLFSAGLSELSTIPGFALTYQLGIVFLDLVGSGDLEVSMFANNIAPFVTTTNLFAETRTGDAYSTIVVGSHLDSVPAGPGINDNGSGSSVNLELAIQLSRLGIPTDNKVRFAWWAAEEFGLLGSKYYVQNLNPNDKNDIALNLNFDMLGSPNFFRGVYNGSGGAENIRRASSKLQSIFENYFSDNELYYELTNFDGRSDYGPFIETGIPAGGLATGAEVLKTSLQRQFYGGLPNVAFDPCYHLVCDTTENVNMEVLDNTAKAAGNILELLVFRPNLRGFLNS